MNQHYTKSPFYLATMREFLHMSVGIQEIAHYYRDSVNVLPSSKFIMTWTHKGMANMHVQIQHKTYIKWFDKPDKGLFGVVLSAVGTKGATLPAMTQGI